MGRAVETLNLGIDGLENIEQIAQGGSSRVFRAHQRELDRTVALKVLKSSDDPEVARRFDRERKAMGRLSHHDGIVPVYSTGVTERGEPYLVMPYYPRGSLQDRIEAGPVPWSEAVGYVSTAAMTMAAAHEMDVVHLDLKPANILLSSTGRPKIADFGIAKLMGDQVHSEDSGAIFTPTFTAPETLMGGQASAAADVYGLGVTLWALIAGRPPFRAMDGEDNTLISIVGRVVHQPIGDLRSLAPDAICRVIEVAAAKDPATRYPTAGAFANALRNAVAEGSGVGSASPVTTAGAATTPMHTAGLGEGLGAPAGAGPAPYDPALPGADSAAGLRFDAAVPPRLVPAPDARGATVSDVVDRYGGALLAVAVAVLVAVGAYAVLQLLGSPAPTALDTDAEVTSSSTTSTPQGALAGAGRSGSGSTAPAGPTTETTEGPTTSTQPSTSATAVATSPAPAPTDPAPTDPPPDPDPTDPPPDPVPDPTPPPDPDPDPTPPPDPDPDPTPPPDPDPDPTPPPDPDPTDPPDPDPLPTPTGLVEIEAQDGLVVIGWSAPAANPGRTGYEVLRSVDGGAPTVVGSIGPSRTRYQDTDVQAGSIYRYQIRALGPASGDPADSALSASLTVDLSDLAPPDDGTPPDDGEPPADPDDVTPG